ncbi:hypothetical protein [Holdemanella porci]|uniref:hypothetical protein n=1 Tax=Holdemanella porci TaxID=2652276 RepID=UPI003FD8F762
MSEQKKTRFLVYTIGMVVLTLGLTLNTLANLGVSPIISVLYSISQIIGLNFINITFVVYAIFVVVQLAIHIQLKNNRIISDLFRLQ